VPTLGGVATDSRTLAAAIMHEGVQGAVDAMRDYLTDGGPQLRGASQNAIFHLVVRSLSDVSLAQRAAFDGYPIQAYSILRPAHEALNLIELFEGRDDLAQHWADGNYNDFRPSEVRRRLGETGQDEFYGFMSEHSHPRFAGVQLSQFIRVGDNGQPVVDPETGAQVAIAYVRDIPYEVPPVLLANAIPGVILARVAVRVGGIQLANDEVARRFPDVLDTVANALRTGWAAIEAVIDAEERRDPEVENPLSFTRDLADVVSDLARELRALDAE
jgi:hypothetical protein